jgi:hypothetical protein
MHTIRILPKDSAELAFVRELLDRLGLEYAVSEGAVANVVSEPAEAYGAAASGQEVHTASELMGSRGRTTHLTEEQRTAIDHAIASLDAGRGIPHEEVMERTRQKFPHLFV